MRKYKLLRDLPDAKAGTIFTFDGDDSYEYESIQYKDGKSWYKENVIHDNPEWFQPIHEPLSSCIYKGNWKNPIRFSKEVNDFIKSAWNVYDDKWRWADFIYKEIAENTYELWQFDELPKSIQERLRPPSHQSESKKDKERDWEVVSFRQKVKQKNEYSILQVTDIPKEYCIDDYLKYESSWDIHSVLRKSDNTTWQEMDKTQMDVEVVHIEKFEIDDNIPGRLKVCIKEGGFLLINQLQKLPKENSSTDRGEDKKEKLFTTEDGVDIYEGGRAYYVEEDANFVVVSHNWITEKRNHKYFSTKEAANAYVKSQKPKQQDKERIYVSELVDFTVPDRDKGGRAYCFSTTKQIPEEKYPAIKSAVESILNNDMDELDKLSKKYGWEFKQALASDKKYTQEEVDTLRRIAFEAARVIVHSGSATEKRLEEVLNESLKSMAQYRDADDYLKYKDVGQSQFKEWWYAFGVRFDGQKYTHPRTHSHVELYDLLEELNLYLLSQLKNKNQ